MNRLAGKVAIVTGAGRGIGRATAKLLAAEGAKVAVLSRTAASVERVASEITSAGGTAIAVACDVSSAEEIAAAIQTVVATLGGIDILVNNAFDASVVSASVLEMTVDKLQRNFDTGPIAHLRTMQACYPHLKKSGQGRVINFGSIAGVTGLAGYGPYGMAKEAIRALTRVAAREWGADGITVNNVLPIANTWGTSDTPPPTNALNRHGSAESDIAPVVVFLASADAQYITGSSLTPDGGAMIDSARVEDIAMSAGSRDHGRVTEPRLR